MRFGERRQDAGNHAGCPVCIEAENTLAGALDRQRHAVEIVYPGTAKSGIAEAERFGVKSIPVLVIAGEPFQINFGAPIEALKN